MSLKLKYFVLKNTWLTRGFINFGWGNGYVVLPPIHSLYKKGYDDINVNVHGGLTFSDFAKSFTENGYPLPEGISEEDWVVGFDTAHGGDNLGNWPEEKVLEETKRLADQLEALA